jgi:uncharacterized membrane protein
MIHRMSAAVLALIGFFISLYLVLWKIGLIGTLACGEGGCETVQLSKYGTLLGLPVALYGVVGYAAIGVTSVVGLQPRWLTRRGPTLVLLGLAAVGVAFSAWLTYVEAAVIREWCRWCLGSAATITLVLASALAGLRETLPSAIGD